MKVVLDTNIVLVILSRRSKYSAILDFFAEENFTWCVTTDILAEYAEIIDRYLGKSYVDYLMEIIEQAKNIEYITTYYRWNLIIHDSDDDKFVDCAVACGAKYIVTEDKHFNVLKNIPFPKVEIIGIKEFVEELHSQ
jgi:putative PIN family toxin of toxin-antitoxin system